MPQDTADHTATEQYAKSLIDDLKAKRATVKCEAYPLLVAVQEYQMTHLMAMSGDVKDTNAKVGSLDTKVDVLQKYMTEELPAKIIEKANGNAEEIKLGLGGKTISGKASTILRFIAALGIMAIAAMVLMSELEKRDMIDAGGKKMVEQAIEKSVEKAMAAHLVSPESPNI